MEKHSIKKLWDEFRNQPTRIIYAKIVAAGMNDHEMDGKILKEIERMQSLRTELLKACRKVLGPHGHDSLFMEYDDKTVKCTTWNNLGETHHSRIDNADSAEEMSVAYAFWAWELRQREKEAGE